ncbi:3-hydroxyacyl-ACP dehydratase FabZ [Schnuerera sp. xch1]|uniref:3-hydroxyacyl-ACP dehydratase FabZ n=1 Tax=Schnuerera sp. xch1 TaxID=2874283 RepID=UPI001CBCE83A|nr:3-hydroxyacyl-ACP dehydratase FabZ [Schnuerera sp. xch1]MBZ2175829.1 3-hydroxyacyl-ACP dehydratase FabZ [Schnuerera sp. xch1]
MTKGLDINDILKIIPHRYPFLLVDNVKILSSGKKGVGYKNITINEPFFQGHFPEMPIMPGVLTIEAMAQVGAVILLSEDKYKGKVPYFAGINKARFKKKIIPGDILRMEVEIIKIRGPIGIGEGKAFVDNDLATEGEFLFAIE